MTSCKWNIDYFFQSTYNLWYCQHLDQGIMHSILLIAMLLQPYRNYYQENQDILIGLLSWVISMGMKKLQCFSK